MSHGLWVLPEPGMEAVPLALQGGSLTTEPPEKPSPPLPPAPPSFPTSLGAQGSPSKWCETTPLFSPHSAASPNPCFSSSRICDPRPQPWSGGMGSIDSLSHVMNPRPWVAASSPLPGGPVDHPHPRVSTCRQLYAAAARQVGGGWLISPGPGFRPLSSCGWASVSTSLQRGVGWWTWPASDTLDPHRNFYVLLLEFVASI